MSDNAMINTVYGIGLLSGLLLGLVIHLSYVDGFLSDCEQSLPRDQNCILTAAPEVRE